MKMEKQEVVFDTVVTTFHMKFENTVYTKAQEALSKLKENSMPIRASVLFEMFPFCILFTVSGTFLLYQVIVLHNIIILSTFVSHVSIFNHYICSKTL